VKEFGHGTVRLYAVTVLAALVCVAAWLVFVQGTELNDGTFPFLVGGIVVCAVIAVVVPAGAGGPSVVADDSFIVTKRTKIRRGIQLRRSVWRDDDGDVH